MKKTNFQVVVFGITLFCHLFLSNAAAQTQTNLPPAPIAGSGSYGRQVAALPNGNFVVVDPDYDAPGITDAGRVYLYNGSTLAIINTMTGTAANDFVGTDSTGRGVTVLASGDYVVSSSAWNGNRGAVTKCSQTTGCPAAITTANSLTGAAANHSIGSNGVTALPNGNYVVRSSTYDNGATTDVGATTFCSATANSCANQQVSVANSLIGSTANDLVGTIGVTVLPNSNYVVQNQLWDNGAATDAGAISFCRGTAICAGTISTANSLIGSTANDYTGNQGVFVLTNGNYVVASADWDNGGTTNVGAATFCSGTTGCTATVSAANSLIGTAADDYVAFNGVTVLSNGNYVVRSQLWNNGMTVDVGAATFCSGTIGCVNMPVTTANSIYGSAANEQLNSAIALTGGKYVVNSPEWTNTATNESNVGASTLCTNTTIGCSGAIVGGNSLIGAKPGDRVGGLTVALTNGNYVVISQLWNNDAPLAIGAGAVTLCSGTTGCAGAEVTALNSLVGSSNTDNVGLVTALTNGNYVVTAGGWNNGALVDVGFAKLCSGTSGCTGAVTAANVLTGSASGDQIGGFFPAFALNNGAYLVVSNGWRNGAATSAGAITRCAAAGCTGTVTTANSLVGSTLGDAIGATAFGGTTILPNGNYVVRSGNWDNGGISNAGAVSYGFGSGGTTGPITVNNSVRGTIADGGSEMNFSYDSTNNQLVVGRPTENIVTVFRPGTPTAASVTVGGRVLKFKSGGVPNARVTMTAPDGSTRIATTNPFGYYRFADVQVGAIYTFSVSAKRQTFNQPTQVRSINEEADDVNFVADNSDGVFD